MKLKKLCAKLGRFRLYALSSKKKKNKTTTSSTMTESNDTTVTIVNGSILSDIELPHELLLEIFLTCDHKTLLSCQLVCKHWRELVQSYVWRKKAETTLNRRLPIDTRQHWHSYYFICDSQPFDRNLVKNHSGAEELDHWEVIKSQGHRWAVECPPVGAPNLPENEAIFAGQQNCFVTSYSECSKYQMIDLLQEGFKADTLDRMQPGVVASEWYSSRFDCPAFYVCKVRLLGDDDRELKNYLFQRTLIEDCSRNKWHKFTHTVRNYGEGLRKIQFIHLGQDIKVWAGHYGSKMAGAYVALQIPADKS